MINGKCDKNENLRLLAGLFLSILVHLTVSNSKGSLFRMEPKETYSDLALILDDKKPELPKHSYVSPSDSLKEEMPKKDTPYLSDKNTSTEQEQIKRGTEGSISPPMNRVEPKVQQKVEPKVESKKPEQKVEKKLETKTEKPISLSPIGKNLFIDPGQETLSEISKESEAAKNQEAKESKKQKDSSEARISSMASLGTGGSSDFLPGLPDGEITMLNAKADRFAVFVRRVALQVFSALKQSNWIDHPQLSSGFQTDGVTIRAILNAKGEFVKAEIIEPSGLVIFDNTVVASVRKGAWDRNPPKEALASDGNIRFLFQSKAWVRAAGPRGKRQWLLLGTGLE